jgi:hypothetical protein
MILRDKALLGHVVHNGESVLGDDGMPLLRAEPLISLEDWVKLQAAIDKSRQQHIRSDTPSMLLHVAFCALCKAPLYKWSKHNTRHLANGEKVKYGPFNYYRCKHAYTWTAGEKRGCGAKLIKLDTPDTLVSEWVASKYDIPDVEERVIPGDNHDTEIAAVNDAMTSLTAQLTREAISDDEYDAKMKSLRAERARLRGLPAEPDTVEPVATGKTIAATWAEMDVPHRRAWLASREVKILAGRNGADVYAIVDARGVHGLATIEVIGNLPGPSLLQQGWARGTGRIVDAEAATDEWQS